MARDLDTQLLESVRVRRIRLGDAFVHGSLAARRTLNNNLRRLLVGVMVAALVCAGCAATSFARVHFHLSSAGLSTSVAPTSPTGDAR